MNKSMDLEMKRIGREVAHRAARARCEGRCPDCDGAGEVRTYDGCGPIMETCYHCGGKGVEPRAMLFTFGTLVDPNVMHRFDPAAEIVARVTLNGWRKKGLNIIREDGHAVPGILWAITPEGRVRLDGYEHYPTWYTTTPVTVEAADGRRWQAFAYRLRRT